MTIKHAAQTETTARMLELCHEEGRRDALEGLDMDLDGYATQAECQAYAQGYKEVSNAE